MPIENESHHERPEKCDCGNRRLTYTKQTNGTVVLSCDECGRVLYTFKLKLLKDRERRESGRRKRCECGNRLAYASFKGKVVLFCDVCERSYTLDGESTIPTRPMEKLDEINRVILRHIASVDYCTPLELCSLFEPDKVSYSCILHRMKDIKKSGYVYTQKVRGGFPARYRWRYYRTEKLNELLS